MIHYKTYVREDQLFLALYGSSTIQSLLFLKNIENFVWFPKQYLLGFFILEKQLANISDGVSCISVTLYYSTLFCCGGKANLVRFTLFYYTLLTLTDGWTDRKSSGKKSSSHLSGGCAIVITTGKKEVLVVCLAGAPSLLRPEKKVLVVCLVGAWSLLRPEKKVLVVCLAGARSLLWPKKKI